MSSSRGLGRGFDSLFPTQVIEEEFDVTPTHDTVLQVSPSLIDPNPHQPRTVFDEEELAGLATSIKQHGILQPLVATAQGERFELIAGERRLRAAKKLGLAKVPVIVRTFDEQQKLELALLENLQRQDLNPIETATAYRKLIDQFNLKYDELSERLGRNRSTIINVVRLLNLPPEAKRALAAGEISEGHARAILAVTDPKRQLELLKLITAEDWTVRKAEEFARTAKETVKTQASPVPAVPASIHSLGEYLRSPVSFEPRAKGGRLVIRYQDEQDLERIIDTITKS